MGKTHPGTVVTTFRHNQVTNVLLFEASLGGRWERKAKLGAAIANRSLECCFSSSANSSSKLYSSVDSHCQNSIPLSSVYVLKVWAEAVEAPSAKAAAILAIFTIFSRNFEASQRLLSAQHLKE